MERDMNLLDPHALDDSLAALSAIKPKRTMVEVTLRVPVDDLDLSNCTLEWDEEAYVFWGQRLRHAGWECDFSSASFAGFTAEIADDDMGTVINYLKEVRGL